MAAFQLLVNFTDLYNKRFDSYSTLYSTHTTVYVIIFHSNLIFDAVTSYPTCFIDEDAYALHYGYDSLKLKYV